MKKYFITLILSFLFCGNLFAQVNQITLPYIKIMGTNGTNNNINATYNGGDFDINITIATTFVDTEPLLADLLSEQIVQSGYDNFIDVIMINYDMSIHRHVMTIRIFQNGATNRELKINGANGGYVNVYQALYPFYTIIGDASAGNWIIKTTYKSPDTTQFNRNITYFDALGAPEQAIQIKASPNMKNIVQPVVYDNMRRSDAKTYLPYVSAGSNAQRDGNALVSQKAFYKNKFNEEDANYAYIEKVYEPAKPVSKQYNVGSVYRDQNKYTSYSYETNAANEVFLLNVNITTGALSVAGYYAAGTLFKNSVTDEDGIKVTTYTDKSGNTILTRAKDNGNQNIDTYYAYDRKGQLRWTLSPEGSAALVNGNTYQTTSDLAKKYCYTYKYDGRGNVIERQLPGKDAEYMVYDKGGRLVMFQDGVMRTQNQWIYNVYDDVNNLTDKSLVQGIMTRAQIQAKYYEPAFKNDYMSLVSVNNIYRPFGNSYFTTVHLISSTRYTGKKYYERSDLAQGIYLKVNTSLIPSSEGRFVSLSSEMPDETTSSIDINGNIIERAKLPDVLMPIDLGDGGGGGSGGGGSNDGGGSGGGGGDGYLPIDPLPPLPVLKPDSVCDPTHLYINHSYNVKNEHLYYTDPNNPNIKYYYLPPAYYSIAECLSSHFVAYTIFEGVPGGAQTTLWTTPSSLAFAPVTGVCTAADLETVNTKNMKAYETVKILMPNGDFVERAFYYDKYGRLIQTVEKNHLGQISRYSVKYDFAGNILAQHESHKTSGSSATDTRLTVFTYDHRGRMLTETTTINSDANSTATVSYEYDQLGNPVKKIFGDNTITETKTYNIQGQLTRKQAKAGNDNIFDLQMKYHDATKAAKSYAGNIAELTWQHENLTTNTYAYTYDKLKRLTSSLHYVGTGVIPIAAFIEQGITYDRNGNILTLKRYGETGLDNDLAYSYNGNKLINLTGVTADTYTYDANGSMTHDGRRGFDVEYNLIDLPFRFYENGFCKAKYTYLADGAKLGVETDSIIPGASEFAQRYTKGFDYLGSFVYSSEQRVRTFESTSFAGGRIQKTNSTYEINYYITDHLGSTRVVVSSGGTVAGTNDYYPFGKLWESAGTQAPTTRYLFSGKEKQITGGINYMDFGSRMYDDFLGRWFTHDPQSYKRPWESPYGYCDGNPVMRIDPDGQAWWLASLISGALSWVSNGLTTGHWGIKSFLIGAAAGLVGAGAGYAAASLGATSLGSSMIGGMASGAAGSALNGDNIAMGAFLGGVGGLAGGATNDLIKDKKFFTRLGVSTLSGGVVSGLFSVAQGGNFWNGFTAGAAGSAAGFLGSWIYEYIEDTKKGQELSEDILNINEEYRNRLQGFDEEGRILVSDNYFDPHEFLLNKLNDVSKKYGIPIDFLRTRDFDPDYIIKIGKMHIRYGSAKMMKGKITKKGIHQKPYELKYKHINVHYDRFDVVLNPILHLIFDTLKQGRKGVY